MIDITDILKLKITNMRNKNDLPNQNGDLEDRIDDIKIRIHKMKLDMGWKIPTEPIAQLPKVKTQSKAEGLAERLLALQ